LDIKNVEVVKGVAENMAFENDCFDLIVSNNGINNVEDMKLSLLECCRVSKPGAQFVFTFNMQGTMMEFYDVFEETLRDNCLVDEINRMKAQIYSKRKPLSEVESLLQTSDFTIVDVKQKSFKIDFVDGTTMLNHYLIKHWFLDEWKKVVKIEDFERIFGQVESRLNHIANFRGHFCLTIPYVTADCTNRKRP
jgi:SAM-dependent methyltransferase